MKGCGNDTLECDRDWVRWHTDHANIMNTGMENRDRLKTLSGADHELQALISEL